MLFRSERERDVVIPGYTHLQRAQPVLAAHYFLAYVEKFQRDRERLADCRTRVNVLPLGAAALAGTSLPIDRESVRAKLATLLHSERLLAALDGEEEDDRTLGRIFGEELPSGLVLVETT